MSDEEKKQEPTTEQEPATEQEQAPEHGPQEALREILVAIDTGTLDPKEIPEATRRQLSVALLPGFMAGGRMHRLAIQIAQWRKRKGFSTNWIIVPEKLMLIVTELSEAMEAYRHLTPKFISQLQEGETLEILKEGLKTEQAQRPEQIYWAQNFIEELADAIIRLLDLAASLDINIETAVAAKMAVNSLRPPKHNKVR